MRRLALGLLLGMVACGGGGEGDADVPPGETLVPVRTFTVAPDTIADQVRLTGRLQPRPGGSAVMTAPAPAFVRDVRVQVGEAVQRGELLVELEAPDLAATAREQSAAADLAERDAARQDELLQKGITSQKKAEEARAAAVSARAQASAAEAALGRLRVTSPLGGVVQSVPVQRGERVDAGATIAQVVNADTLDLVAPAPARDLARLHRGDSARVTSEGVAAAVPARVAALAPAVDSLTNAGQVVVRIPNRKGPLRAGAGATAVVTVGRHAGALVVPDSAIVVQGDSLAVFTVGPDSIAHQQRVRTGVHEDGRTEVLDGLHAGQIVVTTGAYGLRDSMRVRPAGGTP